MDKYEGTGIAPPDHGDDVVLVELHSTRAIDDYEGSDDPTGDKIYDEIDEATDMQVHIVAIAYDGNVSAIVRRDVGTLIEDVIENHGDPDTQYRYTETPEGVEQVIEQIADETGYTLGYQTQEI